MGQSALSSQNPWWIDPDAIDKDRNIVAIKNCPVSWTPRMFYVLNSGIQESIVRTLRGPRQVGKTTIVKLLIKDLLEKGVEGRRILYWSWDYPDSPRELTNLLESYLKTTRQFYPNEELYVFVDEISHIKDWQYSIQKLFDVGALDNVSVLLTGSHSMDIKKSSERLPGRRGSVDAVYDRIFVPMKFAEYVELRDSNIGKVMRNLGILSMETRSSLFFRLSQGDIPVEINELNLYFDEISRLFDEYLITGGIIRSICSYLKDGLIPDNIYNDYVRAVRGDITRWDRSEHYIMQLIKKITESLANPTSWNSLKKATDIGSENTVFDYVNLLKSNFVLCPIFKLDRPRQGPHYDNGKKLIFLDPFIFHALRSWVYQVAPFAGSLEYINDPIQKSKLVESIVGDHFIRFLYNLNPSDLYEPELNVFYWGDKKTEVDYVLKLGKEYLPIEVKYQNSIGGSDYKGLYSFYTAESKYKGLMFSMNKLSIHNEITTLPIPLALLLI